jgi:3-hydroxypropanoate dehydrogenase
MSNSPAPNTASLPADSAQLSSLALTDDAQRLLFHEARTANAFTDEPVTDRQIQAIYDLVKWAPTAANTQPLRLTVVRSPEAKQRLLPLMAEGNRAKTGSAPVTAILAADTRFFAHWDRLRPFQPGGGSAFADDAEKAESTARFNAALQAGYFVLGVRAAGLAAGPMGGFDAAGVDAEFFPDGVLRSVLVVNIGHPAKDAWFDRMPRLDPSEVIEVI